MLNFEGNSPNKQTAPVYWRRQQSDEPSDDTQENI